MSSSPLDRASGCRRDRLHGARTARRAGSCARTLERVVGSVASDVEWGGGDDIIRCIKYVHVVLFTGGQRFREILHSIKRNKSVK